MKIELNTLLVMVNNTVLAFIDLKVGFVRIGSDSRIRSTIAHSSKNTRAFAFKLIVPLFLILLTF